MLLIGMGVISVGERVLVVVVGLTPVDKSVGRVEVEVPERGNLDRQAGALPAPGDVSLGTLVPALEHESYRDPNNFRDLGAFAVNDVSGAGACPASA